MIFDVCKVRKCRLWIHTLVWHDHTLGFQVWMRIDSPYRHWECSLTKLTTRIDCSYLSIYLFKLSIHSYSNFELTPRLISGYLAWQGGAAGGGAACGGVTFCIKQFKGVVEQITFIWHCTNCHSWTLDKLIYIFIKWKKLWVIFSSILSYLIVVPGHVVVGKPL